MDTLEKKISNLIKEQFPAFYLDEGPLFVEFVTAYYKWLEDSGNALYHSRRLFEYKDIDETTDEFVVYFKEKYLRNIQLDTVQNTRQLVKHSLDLYRSKGTERAVELLFKIAFGVNAQIYYPSTDLFKASDGIWKVPNYIEVTLHNDNVLFNNRLIKGLKSKARAFVEAVVRRNNQGVLSDVFYVTDIEGQFIEGEAVYVSGIAYQPLIMGSLTALDVDINGIGSNFTIGQTANLTSTNGIGGSAVVTEFVDTAGQLQFQIIDGGYGFAGNTPISISDIILTLPNTTPLPVLNETIYSPFATLNYVNSTGFFHANDSLTAYYANGTIKGTAIVMTVSESNTTSGALFVEQLTGNISANAIYTTANVVSANLSVVNGFVDLRASGIVMGWNVATDYVKIGVSNTVNAFYPNSYVYTTESLLNANVVSVSNGSGGTFGISNNLLYSETVSLNNDQLGTYANIALNATAYGFPAAPTANLASSLSTAFTFVNSVFGRIQLLVGVRPGSNYTEKPMIRIHESRTEVFDKYNVILNIANASATFAVGEIVEQTSTNARMLVMSANNTTLIGEDLRVIERFDTLSEIVGDSTQATANVTWVGMDMTSLPVGNNANIADNLASGLNAAKKFRIIDSGFGFENGEDVTITIGANNYTATAVTDAVGTGSGYYAKDGGFPSDMKRLYDGFYYQNFSYDVRASVALDKYQKLLKDVVHMAGYAVFGTFVHEQTVAIDRSHISTVISVS